MLFLSVFLVSCSSENISNSALEQYNYDELVSFVSANDKNTMEIYNLYIEEEYELSKFEPSDKIYKGIYLEQQESGFVQSFENFTGVNQNVYLRDINLDEDFPLTWVLGCYSNSKAPFITILPKEDSSLDEIYDEELLISKAKEFGKLDIPMFVNMYPIQSDFDIVMQDKEKYISFFQNAKNYFSIYAPNVSVVWCVDQKMVYEAREFYAGDDYVEWIGINIYEDIDENNTLNIMFNELNFFYSEFSNSKPIFMNLSISHFGNTSFTYNIENKIQELNRFYNDIPYKYPRIKMINYINQDTFNTSKTNKQNYLITDNKQILETYQTNLEQEIYSKVFMYLNNNGKTSIQRNKASFVCYRLDNEFFIKIENLYKLVDKIDEDAELFEYSINNNKYYNLGEVAVKYNYVKILDEVNQNVTIQKTDFY